MREPTVAVAPVSAMTRGKSSADFARMASAASRIRAPRSSADQAAHAWLRLLGRGRRRQGVVSTRVGRPPNDLFGRRVDDLVGPVGRIDPLAPDEELVLVAVVVSAMCAPRSAIDVPADLTARHIQLRLIPTRQSRWHRRWSPRQTGLAPPAPRVLVDAESQRTNTTGANRGRAPLFMTFVTSQGRRTCGILYIGNIHGG